MRQQEAEIQKYVFARVDHAILRVLEVYRHFSGDFNGLRRNFLVMEYIPGEPLDQINISSHPELIKRVGDAIRHLATLEIPRGHPPGPMGENALAKGYL